ncbi:flap endonuclease GEN isoform X2 [Aricia agestis]|uniref:flap endonuclease GEN isoform X2 n=1 Tax=Aricia agestis TaxID=91739 RepID=UPI001C207F17|nr:flap endonuclease GEN isoform X2 [Aricia agestis]
MRNLFFRTMYLLLADINPIFVLEGDAPELKRDVMTARNALQFRGAAPKSGNSKNKEGNVTRKRFKGVLKECENLLKTMGVRCVKGDGEAEATCARLNAKGVVDAVISQDSDCFAYGARRVYRNFSVSNSAGGGALNGSVDVYDADVMFKNNGFGRKKMVALALLCGCDYGVGACGSSINTVVSFLHTVPEEEVVFRLLSWVSEPQKYEKLARWVATPGVCDRCGHAGRTHNRHGCPVCATSRACTDTGHKVKVSEAKRELSLRSRALSAGMPFPEPRVMKEFLDTTPEDVDVGAVKMPTPSLIQFVKIMSHKLDWPEKYCVEKFLPLLTKWHLQDHVPVKTIKPIAIKKKRNPKGVPSFEVQWEDIDGLYDALIPDDQFEEGEDASDVWTTIERQDLMRKYHPDIVEAYEESIKKPSKEKKTRARKKKDDNDAEKVPKQTKKKAAKKKSKNDVIAELSRSLGNLSVSKVADISVNKSQVSVSVNKLKRKHKISKTKHKNTIESYLKPAKKRKSNRTKSMNYSKNIFVHKQSTESFSVEKHNDNLFEDIGKENITFKHNSFVFEDNEKENISFHNDVVYFDDNDKENIASNKLFEDIGKENVTFKHNSFVFEDNEKENISFHNDVVYLDDNDKENIASNKLFEDIGKENVTFKHNSFVFEDNAKENISFHNDVVYFDDNDKENIASNKLGLSILDVSQGDVPESDLSDIIDKITSRETTATKTKVNDAYVKLIFNKKFNLRKSILRRTFNQNCSTPNQSPVKRKSSVPFARQSINTSYFYDKLTDQCDAFEMSLEYKNNVDVSDATIDYSLPDVKL